MASPPTTFSEYRQRLAACVEPYDRDLARTITNDLDSAQAVLQFAWQGFSIALGHGATQASAAQRSAAERALSLVVVAVGGSPSLPPWAQPALDRFFQTVYGS